MSNMKLCELFDGITSTMEFPSHLSTDKGEKTDGHKYIPQAIAEGASIPHRIITDRPEAVRIGLESLRKGDILVITGKGPEKFITIKDKKIPFNDAEAVKSWRDSQ